MIGREGCDAILDRAVSLAADGAADFYLSAQDLGLTRFAGNAVHQNVAHSDAQLHVRAAAGRRLGRAVTNDLSPEGIARGVEQARRNALLMPEDPDFPGLPLPGPAPVTPAFDPTTAAYTPEDRARAVSAVCRAAADRGLDAFGACRTGVQETAVAGTHGVRAYHAGTFAGLLITMMSGTSSGWAKGGSWRVGDLDPRALAKEAAAKALDGENPGALEPGRYPVVLDHYAVDDILSALSLYGMGAQAVQEGRSWMNGLMRQAALSPLVSIWDDGADPAGWPAPFDTEGMPRRKVEIVTDGVVGEPVHNSYTAAKEGKVSTGHQVNFGGAPYASNLFMREGSRTLEQLIASTPQGLYVTRFHYTRLVHNRGCVMTGMTRDGVFLIEEGRLSGPVKDLRFTQSYVDALAGVEAVGDHTRLSLNEAGFATRAPRLKLAEFNFTGVTA